MPYGRVLETKLINALLPDAEANTSGLPRLLEQAVGSVLSRFRSYYKGLWVGGRATLTDTHLVFEPNGVNNLEHQGDTSFAVPLNSITDMSVEPAFLTKVIAMRTHDATYRIRCFGAACLRT